MKLLKIATLLLLLAVAGCKESTDGLFAAHATPADTGVTYQYAHSGDSIPTSAARGQVYEYH
jgi:hypothetical protein